MSKRHWFKVFFKQDLLEVVRLKEASTQHQIDRVTLSDGSRWLCKRFAKRNWLGKIDLASLTLCEELAARVAKELGITFAAYSLKNNTLVQTVDDDLVILLPYCEGQILTQFSEDQATRLGRILAQIHALQLPKTGAQPFPAIVLSAIPSRLKKLANACNRSSPAVVSKSVLSHRDIHSANIIWRSDEDPHLIDWESSGLIHPAIELLGLAYNCSGIGLSNFDIACFRATLSGYSDYAGSLPELERGLFDLTLHSWLLWYVHCIEQHWQEESRQTLAIIELISDMRAEIEGIYFDFFRERNDESD